MMHSPSSALGAGLGGALAGFSNTGASGHITRPARVVSDAFLTGGQIEAKQPALVARRRQTGYSPTGKQPG